MKIFQKLVKFTLETQNFPNFFQCFYLCDDVLTIMDIWKMDLVREIMMKQKGLSQMKKLSYDTKYQNGHAMSLESLIKCLGSLGILG